MSQIRTLHLRMTPGDITTGEPGSPDWCPIACCIRRTFPDIQGVGVSADETDIYTAQGCWVAKNTDTIMDFIEAFDTYGDCQRETGHPHHLSHTWNICPCPDPIDFSLEFTLDEE